jgi:putative transposase
MMAKKRRSYTPEFKFRIALDALKGMKTIAQIGQEHQVHPNQVRAWKKQLQEEGSLVFSQNHHRTEKERELKEEALYEQIGRLQMELAWLKKKAASFD